MKPCSSTLVALAGAALLLAWCGRQQPRLQELRTRHALTPESAAEGTPPLVAFTTVILGGFRGPLADVLWLRVSRLQDDGRYFELVQLSDWITKLEPRSTGTWAFHAWNMAYNVSAMMADPAQRWRWVQNGVHLLRDEGLRYNPRDARLYFELGWMFQHKMGTQSDRAWLYFQQRLAVETEALLPDGRLPGPAEEAAVAQALRAQLGLELKHMRAIEARYGELDWRLPEAQALYWADLGLARGGDAHDLRCERMRYQCLAAAFMNGTLEMNSGAGLFVRSARPSLFGGTVGAYAAALAGPNGTMARESYRGFLGEAERVLEKSGHTEDAARARALLVEAQKRQGEARR